LTERWPNLFLIGATRAGTTSFYHYLAQHPEIFMSPMKEPGFFAPEGLPAWVDTIVDERDYLGLFRAGRSAKVLGEASGYLSHPEAAERIRARSPDARVLAILREPVDRAYSHYLMDVRDGVESRPFREVLLSSRAAGLSSYERYGLYCDQVRRYVDVFGPNLLVLFFEEVFRDVRGSLHRVFEFLGVEPLVSQHVNIERHNSYAQPRNRISRVVVGVAGWTRGALGRPVLPKTLQPIARKLVLTSGGKPPMDSDSRAHLAALYERQRECLKKLLGVDPPWPHVSE
jgi:Sulfotransferase domain